MSNQVIVAKETIENLRKNFFIINESTAID